MPTPLAYIGPEASFSIAGSLLVLLLGLLLALPLGGIVLVVWFARRNRGGARSGRVVDVRPERIEPAASTDTH